jgi:hypothetical protein
MSSISIRRAARSACADKQNSENGKCISLSASPISSNEIRMRAGMAWRVTCSWYGGIVRVKNETKSAGA